MFSFENSFLFFYFLGVPLTQHSSFNLCKQSYIIISKRQKMLLKEFHTAVLCSGQAASGFAFASANVLK
jgi:hypothetical protein